MKAPSLQMVYQKPFFQSMGTLSGQRGVSECDRLGKDLRASDTYISSAMRTRRTPEPSERARLWHWKANLHLNAGWDLRTGGEDQSTAGTGDEERASEATTG